MTCEEIAYPYLDQQTGHHKHVATIGAGICATVLVKSNMAEVPIDTIPLEDDFERGTPGITPFCRAYPQSAPLTVTLTAPSSVMIGEEEVFFRHWRLDGAEQPITETVLVFEVGQACREAVAIYGPTIEPLSCSQIQMPSHVLITAGLGDCEIFCPAPKQCGSGAGYPGCTFGTVCLEPAWHAHGSSIVTHNHDGQGGWFGEEIFAGPCPEFSHLRGGCPGPIDCAQEWPEHSVPQVCPLPTVGFTRVYLRDQSASFGINCHCDFNTNIATMNWGVGFSKRGCKQHQLFWLCPNSPPEPCGGGGPHADCYASALAGYQVVIEQPPAQTARFDGSQAGCDATVAQLVNNTDFSTPFDLHARAGGGFPHHVVHCLGGTMRATF